MTAKEFRDECELGYNHFQELTSTGIKPNYVNIERFAEEYHQTKLKLLGIANVSDLLIAWEQFKKTNWWESDAVDVEKVLMDKFQVIYGR